MFELHLNYFQDYDLNDDRRIDLAEYMKAVFGEGALEVEWKEGEEQFVKDRDLDQDGFMDKEEVRSWMLPEAYDEHQVEETEVVSDKTDFHKMKKLKKGEHQQYEFLFLYDL